MRNRQKGILVFLSDKERKHLDKQAKSQLIRKLIMDEDIQPRPPEELPKLLKELNYIGHNINQIAHKANAEDKATLEQLQEVQQLLGEIYCEVKR